MFTDLSRILVAHSDGEAWDRRRLRIRRAETALPNVTCDPIAREPLSVVRLDLGSRVLTR